MNIKKTILFVGILILIVLFFALDLNSYFTLEYFQSQRDALLSFKQENFVQMSLAYFLLYVTVAALSLPAAAILTLIGGAIFGLGWGLVLVSFASSIGATCSFLASRLLLQDWVQKKFSGSIESINKGIDKDGAFYLFSLRLIPLFPFFLVNLVMGLTRIRVFTFYWVSQLGMLLGTALYVNLGAQLGQATSIPDIFTLNLLLTFIALAIFPWFARAVVNKVKSRRTYSGVSTPKHYDVNMVVIGAGAAGLVTSLIASLVKAKVILVEKHKMGGDCLNTGCVPSKALLKTASVNHMMTRAEEFGIEGISAESTQVNFQAVMQRVRDVIKKIEPHDSVERYEGFGVQCLQGEATIKSPFEVEVNGRTITTRNIVVASGARPFIPSVPGLDEVDYYTSDTIWNMPSLPKRMLVLGGGPIGCELSQAFSRLGATVTQMDMSARIMPREDEEISALLTRHFEQEGISVLTSHKVKRFEKHDAVQTVIAEHQGADVTMEFDVVLLAVGRKANVSGFGLEDLQVALAPNGTIEVNEYLQTNYPNIYACGDVAGPYQFTHMASHQAWYASVNGLFGFFKKYKVNYSVVPWATFVDPEVARVGLNETEAKAQGIPYELTRYELDDLDRAIADSEDKGFVKILTVPGKDKILGATIVGYHAGELITEFVTAMTHNLGLKKIMATIHIYPTLSESNKFAASEWRKSHAPEWVYPWLEKFHSWRR